MQRRKQLNLLDLLISDEELARRKKALKAYINSRKCSKLRKRSKKKTKKEKRTHFLFPTYKKIYTVCQLDWKKYAAMFKKLRKRAYCLYYGKSHKAALRYWQNIAAYEIAQKCYIYDKYGILRYLGDEKHIYRMNSLQEIYSRIYNYCEKEALQKFGVSKQHGLICFIEDQQAELEGTWKLPIKQRLKVHIQILRNLQKGLSLEESIKEIDYEI